MKFELFTKVILTVDLPQYNLKWGQIGTIVECYPMSNGEEAGYSLEGLLEQDTIEVSESQISSVLVILLSYIQALLHLTLDNVQRSCQFVPVSDRIAENRLSKSLLQIAQISFSIGSYAWHLNQE